MSYELAWRFWFFANDNGGRMRRAVQRRPPDYPGLTRLQLMLAAADTLRDSPIQSLSAESG
jgi:hypothetical protein